MQALGRIAAWLFASLALASCASSEVTSYQPYQGKIARPDRILVYDIAASPADLPADIAAASPRALPAASETPQELATGRELGTSIAKFLVEDLRAAGLPAVRVTGAPGPRPGDALVTGYFVSVDPGDAAKRVVLGFGSGAAELKTVIQGFLMTPQGLSPLGSGEVAAGSGKTPGGAVPLAVAVATANPVGLIVGGAAKAYGEVSGSETIEGAAERTAQSIAEKLRATAQRQGWI